MRALVVAAMLAPAFAHAETPDTADTVEPDAAQRLSIIGTAVPLAIVGLGVAVAYEGQNNAIRDIGSVTVISGTLLGIVTPSLGHFYSRDYLDGAIWLRVGGLVVGTIGLVKVGNSELGDCEPNDPSCHIHASTYALLAGGIAMYLGGMALDVATSQGAARAWNKRHELAISPTALRAPSSPTVPAVAVSLVF